MDGGGGGGASPDAAAVCIAPGPGAIVAVAPAGIRVENCYVFKSRLQEYAQKAGLPTPEYHTLKEGPSHEPVFRSTVLVNGTTYESLPGFFSRKAAEQSAAEVALMEIAVSAPVAETRSIPAVQETGLCKNLLQEYAQKMNYALPSYICTKHAPFVCTVEIGGIQYIGAAARTKKEAEIKAARTALLAIQGQSEGCANGAKKYIVVPGQRPVKETDKKPIETPKPLKVRKRGSRRKWNKRKFVGMADQIVDAEKDVDQGLGLLLPYDYEETRRIEYELSRDTAMVQFNQEVIVMQPGEGDRIVQPESPRDPAQVQHNNEARSVEQDPFSDAEVVKANNEAITIEHESVSVYVALRSNGDSTDVEEAQSNTSMVQGEESKTTMPMQEAHHTGELVRIVQPESPRDPAQVRHNNEDRSVKQDPLSNAEVVKANNKATTIEHESVSTNVALQSNGDSTDVKEAPSNTSMMQGEESETTMQEAHHTGEGVQPN